MLSLLFALALANEPPPPMVPRFEITPPPTTSASFPNGFRLQVQDSGEEAVTVATWVSGGSPQAARSAAELFYARTVGGGLTVREAYQQVGAGSEAMVYGDGTLFVAVGPAGSLDVLLTLERARFSTSDGRVDDQAWERARSLGSPWVRDERVAAWTDPILGALYPEPHPYHPEAAEGAELAEARAFARELYLPGNAATLVLGDFDELARHGVLGTYSESFDERAGELVPPEPSDVPPPPPATQWVEVQGDESRVAVGWRLPGLDEVAVAELEATRFVVERQMQLKAKSLRPRCLLEPRLQASTLVCSTSLDDPDNADRWVRKLGKAAHSAAVEDHLELVHGAWAQQRMVELSSASWQAYGAARTQAPRFGLTGDVSMPEAVTAEAVDALIDRYLDPERAVALSVRPTE